MPDTASAASSSTIASATSAVYVGVPHSSPTTRSGSPAAAPARRPRGSGSGSRARAARTARPSGRSRARRRRARATRNAARRQPLAFGLRRAVRVGGRDRVRRLVRPAVDPAPSKTSLVRDDQEVDPAGRAGLGEDARSPPRCGAARAPGRGRSRRRRSRPRRGRRPRAGRDRAARRPVRGVEVEDRRGPRRSGRPGR